MPSTAFADVIYLKNGRKIVGQVTQEDSKQVIYSIQGGELSIPMSMVDHIQKSADSTEEQPPQESETRGEIAGGSAAFGRFRGTLLRDRFAGHQARGSG